MLKTKKPFQINDLEWFDLMLAETVVSISDPAGVTYFHANYFYSNELFQLKQKEVMIW